MFSMCRLHGRSLYLHECALCIGVQLNEYITDAMQLDFFGIQNGIHYYGFGVSVCTLHLLNVRYRLTEWPFSTEGHFLALDANGSHGVNCGDHTINQSLQIIL